MLTREINKVKNQKFIITADQAKKRLDKFLCEQMPDISRAQIQKMIKLGAVLVNDRKVPVHHFLKEGEAITINFLHAQTETPVRESKGASPHNRVAEAFMPRPEIIADTPSYLILNKPAGLLVHEAPGNNEPTLVDWLLEKYPQLKKIGEDPQRPGIVHRLDREVSGLIVVPKTQAMFDHLKKQFKTRQIKKEYTALVYGSPQKMEGEISFNIDRSQTAGHKMAAVPRSLLRGVPDERGRKAVTAFEVIEQLGRYTLLKIRPQTGRTHQIRVHLNAYGLPIVGDLTYHPKKLKIKFNLGRIFLHADYLGFHDLNNKWREYSLPLADELNNFLDKLKKG